MNRALIISFAIMGVALTAFAQKRAAESVSISGCVEQVQRDGSLGLTAAGTTATPNTAATEANSGEVVDAFRLTSATVSSGVKDSSDRTEYALQGNGPTRDKHVGHRVEIRGSLLPSVAESQTGKAGPAEGIARVQVTAVKMIATKCSNKG